MYIYILQQKFVHCGSFIWRLSFYFIHAVRFICYDRFFFSLLLLSIFCVCVAYCNAILNATITFTFMSNWLWRRKIRTETFWNWIITVALQFVWLCWWSNFNSETSSVLLFVNRSHKYGGEFSVACSKIQIQYFATSIFRIQCVVGKCLDLSGDHFSCN